MWSNKTWPASVCKKTWLGLKHGNECILKDFGVWIHMYIYLHVQLWIILKSSTLLNLQMPFQVCEVARSRLWGKVMVTTFNRYNMFLQPKILSWMARDTFYLKSGSCISPLLHSLLPANINQLMEGRCFAIFKHSLPKHDGLTCEESNWRPCSCTVTH